MKKPTQQDFNKVRDALIQRRLDADMTYDTLAKDVTRVVRKHLWPWFSITRQALHYFLTKEHDGLDIARYQAYREYLKHIPQPKRGNGIMD